jgi:hypothetical protein
MRHIADIQTVYCLMTITKNPQIQTEIYQNQEKTRKTKDALGDVRQLDCCVLSCGKQTLISP